MAKAGVTFDLKADVEQFMADLNRVGKDIEVTALLVGIQQRYQRQLQWYCGGAALGLAWCAIVLGLNDAPLLAVVSTVAAALPFAFKAYDPR